MMDSASILTALIWNVGDERLQIALHEVVDYCAEADGDSIDPETIMNIIAECLAFGHTHLGDELEIHILPHEPLKTEAEIEESVSEFRRVLGIDNTDEEEK